MVRKTLFCDCDCCANKSSFPEHYACFTASISINETFASDENQENDDEDHENDDEDAESAGEDENKEEDVEKADDTEKRHHFSLRRRGYVQQATGIPDCRNFQIQKTYHGTEGVVGINFSIPKKSEERCH